MTVKVTFYHDVLCVWCFLLSPRLRRLAVEFGGELEIEHRGFALAPRPESIAEMFGGDDEGKTEVLRHWAAAAGHPDGERIHTELMRQRDFSYPYSMPGLLACQAAAVQGGQNAYWNMFDRVQKAHATEARNIADSEVLEDLATEIGLDMGRWKSDFQDPATRQTVQGDIEQADALGIYAVPTLVLNDRWVLQGAVAETDLRRVIATIVAGGDPSRLT